MDFGQGGKEKDCTVVEENLRLRDGRGNKFTKNKVTTKDPTERSEGLKGRPMSVWCR